MRPPDQVSEMREGPDHEGPLSISFANVKIFFTLVNLVSIALDRSLPPRDLSNLGFAWIGGLTFLGYAVAVRFIVGKRLLSAHAARWVLPATDIAMATVFILLTDARESPYFLWIPLLVASTGFSSLPSLPVYSAACAMVSYTVIALAPGREPQDWDLFLVRMAFVWGFALVGVSLGTQLGRHSRDLFAVSQCTEEMGNCRSESDAVATFANYVRQEIGAFVTRVDLQHRSIIEFATTPSSLPALEWPLRSGEALEGSCTSTKSGRWTGRERRLMSLLCERLASRLRRIRLSDDLVREAAHQERVSLADELHDSYLQTLAAIDMHAEICLRQVPSGSSVATDLELIKRTVRTSAERAREFIDLANRSENAGIKVFERVLAERMPDSVFLTTIEEGAIPASCWWALIMILKEGLNNALRHGKAKHAKLLLDRSGRHVELTLAADGQSPPAEFAMGYGLRRLEAITRAMGGSIELEANPTGGSILRARLEVNDLD